MPRLLATLAGLLFASALNGAAPAVTTADLTWAPHDPARPRPPQAAPLPPSALQERAQPPAGAIILFNGQGLAAWATPPTRWTSTADYVEISPQTDSKTKRDFLKTNAAFGSVRLHLEWWTPPGLPLERSGQKRSNSGVFFMGLYEVQVLDSFDAGSTYADGGAGALYGQFPPLANALRPAGEWQYYDIEFHRPAFDGTGRLLEPARLTVYLNGVLVQANAALTGPTVYRARSPYKAHSDQLPLQLQDHGDLVRFRNIWVVPLSD